LENFADLDAVQAAFHRNTPFLHCQTITPMRPLAIQSLSPVLSRRNRLQVTQGFPGIAIPHRVEQGPMIEHVDPRSRHVDSCQSGV
jgi:hypothetical protein